MQEEADEVLVTKFSTYLQYSDIQTLKDKTWLNDEVINFYLLLVQQATESDYNKVHVMNSFFATKLVAYATRVGGKQIINYKEQRPWTRKVTRPMWYNRVILIPINIAHHHWTLLAVYPDPAHRAKMGPRPMKTKMMYLCSFGTSNGEPFTSLTKQWYAQEMKERCKSRKKPRVKFDKRAIEWAYRETLTRYPTTEELADARAILQSGKTPENGMADLRWALFNSHEFRYLP